MIGWLAIIWCLGSTVYYWGRATQPWYVMSLDTLSMCIIVAELVDVI